MAALRSVDASGTTRRLPSNQVLVLDEPRLLRVVVSGTVAVFSTRLEDGRPAGARRFLFRAQPGSPFLGWRPRGGRGLLAVAVGEVELDERELLEEAGPMPEPIARLVESWCVSLTALMRGGERPRLITRVGGAREVELESGAALLPARDTQVWAEVQEGRAAWLGEDHLAIESGSGWFPLTSGSWLKAEGLTKARSRRVEDLTVTELLAGLDELHRLVESQLGALEERETEEATRRERERRGRQAKSTRVALQDIASVLDGGQPLPELETPLLTAAAIVARHLGVTLKPPRRVEELAEASEPLELIARASRLRVRRVLLRPDWWLSDAGPLIASLGKERRPVALLPSGSDGYDIVDPIDGSRRALEPIDREQLAPEAHALHVPLPEGLRRLPELARFSLRGRGTDLALVVVTALAATVLGFVTPVATAAVMDSAIPGADGRFLLEMGLAMGAAAFGAALLTLAQGFIVLRTSVHADLTAQCATWDRLLRVRPSFFRRYSSGDLLDRATTVRSVSQELNGVALRSVLVGLMSVLNLGLLFHYESTLALVAVGAGASLLLASLAAARVLRPRLVALQESRGQVFGLVVQLIGGVAKLRTAGAEKRAYGHWMRRQAHQLRLVRSTQAIQDVMTIVNQALPTLATLLLFFVASDLLLASEAAAGGGAPDEEGEPLGLGGFLAFNTAFGTFLAGVTGMSQTIIGLLDTLQKSRRIRPLLEEPLETTETAADPGRLRGGLALESVVFRYREDGPVTLDDVSFSAQPGEFVALVGPSGSGKSTVLRLVLGLERPSAGRVLLDGRDLDGLDVLAVRRQVGTVLQLGRVNAGSILSNIRGGNDLTLDEAWAAAEDAGLAADIREMPMQMHTVVSEGGGNLSGGQRQRLLIAAALATQPELILFDEATSALDNPTQETVSRALERRRVTRVVVAHRLSTIEKADRILVLDAGRIVQEGTYDELSRQDGLFRRMVARQVAS
ncbi:MAG: NHLP bacteriocin export ABC transporter permease/ATPase subunit [Acidobacteriota bacterium]